LLTLDRILRECNPAGLTHTPGGVSGLLDDQVQTAAAFVDAYEATGNRAWLQRTEHLMDEVWSEYWDGDAGGLFDTARSRRADAGLLPARAKAIQDAPTPSSNGVAGIVVARLHELTNEGRWKERAESLLRAFGGRAGELGLYAATYLLAIDWHLNPATHVVVVGEPHDPTAHAMHHAALAAFVPRRVIQWIAPSEAEKHPLPAPLRAMLTSAEAPRGYACTGTSCSRPAADLVAWQATLESLRPEVPA
jgi:hypothetical protein